MTTVVELLEQMRPAWIDEAAHRLASAERVREDFLFLLQRYYDLLLQALVSDDSSVLDSLLLEWMDALSLTDVDSIQSNLPPMLNQFQLITFDVARRELGDAKTLDLMVVVLPIHAYCLEYVYIQETELQVQRVSNELNKARMTLERLEKSKSDFIAVAAHELKTPLTLIEGYASMLREIWPDEDSNSATQFMKGISSGTRRLREIVDDMIDVSVIDNDMLSLNVQPVWVNRLIDMARRDVAESVRERHQTLEIRDFPGSAEMTFGDGERLLQAFRNVISNAIKYTPDGGKITVDGRLLPGFVEVTISDTGIGIDPENHTRIFEKFGRLGNVALHSTSKTRFKGGGPGLGLPITKGVIEAHGGAIWVESEGYDEARCPGSTFHVLLPLRQTPPDDKTAKLFRP